MWLMPRKRSSSKRLLEKSGKERFAMMAFGSIQDTPITLENGWYGMGS
jgi:hypothetical protein